MIFIALSSYNGARYIGAQIESILAQSEQNFHLFIRDDGSTDETCAIIEGFQSAKITLIKQENVGIIASFNALLERFLQSDYNYLMFCDQDDIWHTDKIKQTLQAVQNKECVLAHSDLTVVDAHLKELDGSFMHYQNLNPMRDRFENLLMQNMVTGCTTLIDRALAQKVAHIPKDAIMHDHYIALVASYFGKIVFIPQATMLYRQHSANDTGAKAFTLSYIVKKALTFLDKRALTESMRKNIAQAKAFKHAYSIENSTLDGFIDLYRLNSLQKRRFLCKNDILKHGFIRNIALLLRV